MRQEVREAGRTSAIFIHRIGRPAAEGRRKARQALLKLGMSKSRAIRLRSSTFDQVMAHSWRG
jgi:hypothetical protein